MHPIKKKSNVFQMFKEFKAQVKLETSKRIKLFRTNNFITLCKQDGIIRQFTVSHMPQCNGVAERMNITIIDKIRSMMRTTQLAKSFWVEAMKVVCYVTEISIICNWFENTMVIWNGKPNDYSTLHVFG